jgi:hypothetical protein
MRSTKIYLVVALLVAVCTVGITKYAQTYVDTHKNKQTNENTNTNVNIKQQQQPIQTEQSTPTSQLIVNNSDLDDTMKPLVTLVMIVRNEANSIVHTLESTLNFIDRYSIVDTGSTDETKQLMTNWFQSHLTNEQWNIFERPFIDFSTTRNEALQLAGNVSEFIFMLNGDDSLVGGHAFRQFLQKRAKFTGPQEAMYIVPINYGGKGMGRSER